MQTNYLSFDKVNITGGFWHREQSIVRNSAIHAVYDRFYETGRIGAFRMDWKEGMPNKPHIFWDSDVAKWMEGAAYLIEKQRDPELEAIVDDLVEKIGQGRMADGYFNITYQTFWPEKRFTERSNHELYCAGHLIEAAIAYDHATGKRKFLNLMEDYAALIKKCFMDEQTTVFRTPGHEEIELALVKLYRYTGKQDWLDLASFFVENRGHADTIHDGDELSGTRNIQDHVPVRQQKTAEGHAVRLSYLFSAVADLAKISGDEELKDSAEKVYDSITRHRMYVTGSVGSSCMGEKFEQDYHLPLDNAYAETCAALALALFSRRMEELDNSSRYADTVERVIYNGLLSGMSLDGTRFFYENAQEIDLQQRKFAEQRADPVHFPGICRVGSFDCSCCPPNMVRFIPSIGDFLYNYTEDTIYVNQYMESDADFGGTRLVQKTRYPYDGAVTLELIGKPRTLALRIPGWCKAWTLTRNGEALAAPVKKGFAFVEAAEGDEICLNLQLQVRYIHANPHVTACRGLLAVGYGPFILCMEGIDNGGDLCGVKLVRGAEKVLCDPEAGTLAVEMPAVREKMTELFSQDVETEAFTARLIPYYTFANREETDLRTWVPVI